ncbi:MAG: DUF2723 domain-containing protein [Rikenellaceae bacterium]|jgi:hypothetical protein|nr:DUF2723 domain-containing protein [Rikenellaceae bacterium]
MNLYKKYNLILGWACFVIASTVYLLTMEPSASLWDCGEFLATSYKLEVGHPPGAPLFMMMMRFFQLFAPSPEYAAVMGNSMSALASGFTILFLFWTITMLALRWFGKRAEELSRGELWAVMGAGAVGALAYTFTDTFWFSAVEGEVYGLSSFFTAVVFWAMLRWEQVADQPRSTRWLVLIAYLMGLSIGVHLLNLLAVPAMVFLFYFKKYPTITRKGVLAAFGVSVAVVAFVLYVICPWTIRLGAWTDLFFVNSLGLPVNSGMAVYAILLFALLAWGVWYTYKRQKPLLNTFVLMTAVVILGYSSYASVIIRSAANPPMNSNDPSNPFGLMMLLNRDQYGSRPLLSGQSYAAPPIGLKEKTYYYIGQDNRYVPYTIVTDYEYPREFNMLFPRLFQYGFEDQYKEWVDIQGKPVSYMGQVYTVPTFGENLTYFFRYQLNFMYWRYFLWNFVGRQNDNLSTGGILDGNWLSGIDAIDSIYLGPQNDLPDEMAGNRARNRYFFLPFLLGILGILAQLKRDGRGFTVILWLFFMTGIAIILYLNQTPGEPRERDYAFAGSFYAFSIWIGLGVLWVYDALQKRLKKRRISAAVATALCLSVPVILCAQNWDDHTRAHRYLARDFGYNYLQTCLPGSIIMNYGDNDTFPLWFNQEVESVRPDVRVMNLSYLGGEWYIDQMKLKVNDSEAVPFTIPQELYYGVNGSLSVIEGRGVYEPIGDILAWIKSTDPRTKETTYSGEQNSTIPSRTIALPVNKANAIAAGIIRPEEAEQALDTIKFTIKGNSILRSDMMLLDLLAHFDWKRPLYFTQPHTIETLGLRDYLQQDGFAYRLVPFKTPYSYREAGRIDTEYLYGKLMNDFRYANLKDPRVNVDYFTRYTVGATQAQSTFGRLAMALTDEGQPERAEQVLNRAMEEFPASQIPHDYLSSTTLIEAWYKNGNPAKANALLNEYAASLEQSIAYLLRFPENKQELVFNRLREDVTVLSDLSSLAEKYEQPEIADQIDAFFTGVGL